MCTLRILRKSVAALCTVALVLTQFPRSLQSAPLEERLAAYDYISEQAKPYNELLSYLGPQLDRSVYETTSLSESLGGDPAGLPRRCGPPSKLGSGGYGRPAGLTGA
jgi:hypothetical protein